MSEAAKPAPPGIIPGRFAASNAKLGIWARNEKTDVWVSEGSDRPVLKTFKRSGGFEGSSPNATYIVKRLTAEFGPVGTGWGYDIAHEAMLQGAPVIKDGVTICHETVHMLRIEFWYVDAEGVRHCFQQFGQTTFVGGNKYGAFTDEEAPKKSLTDAVTKAAAWLGFGADVHMGMWDDTKYINDTRNAAEHDRAMSLRAQQLAKPYCFISANGDLFTSKTAAEWQNDWFKRIKALVEHDKTDQLRQAWAGNAEALVGTRSVDPTVVAEVERQILIAIGEPAKGEPAPPDEPQTAAPESQPAPANDPDPPKVEYPAERPTTFKIVGRDSTTYDLGKGNKGAPAETRWLASWRLSLGSLENVTALDAWYAANAEHLALMHHYHPEIGQTASAEFEKQREALSSKFPGDLPSGQRSTGK